MVFGYDQFDNFNHSITASYANLNWVNELKEKIVFLLSPLVGIINFRDKFAAKLFETGRLSLGFVAL